MTVLSLLRAARQAAPLTKAVVQHDKDPTFQFLRKLTTSAVKCSGAEGPFSLKIVPSRFMWHKYKDQFHFYFFLGVIPLSALVFYANVFIGPSTLAEIPEGYEPKKWEYFRSPVTRWFAKYCMTSPQQTYERNLHYINLMEEKRRMRLLQWKVDRLMRERGDYPNYYTNKTFLSRYVRDNQREHEYIDSTTGDF